MSDVGKVYLVGAGPGDPGLLTLKGRACLQQADLVLYDGLVNPLILRHTAAHAERTSRVTGPDGRRLEQAEINEKLIAEARQGKTVVRLKGGDPYIFGRGSEEAAALKQAGIPYEVVPGITAATAAAEYAGLSLTHRQLASAVAFITGHEDPTKSASSLDYENLAQFPGTLVFYMGLHRLSQIASALIAAGKDATTAVAVISRASMPLQRTVTGTLDSIAAAVQEAELHAPSLTIVGDCVTQRQTVDWFEERPLFGQRIGIPRPADQADEVIDQCLELGAQPVLMPTIEIHPPEDVAAVDKLLSRMNDVDWLIFTSANGVRFLFDRAWELGHDARLWSGIKFAVVGSSTADVLKGYRLRADVIAPTFQAEDLATVLGSQVANQHVVWARGSRGRDALPQMLEAAGAQVEQVVVYRSEDAAAMPSEAVELIESGELDWIALSSSSIVRSLVALLSPAGREQLGNAVKLAAISPLTAQSANDLGLSVAAVADEHTWDGLFQAMIDAGGAHSS